MVRKSSGLEVDGIPAFIAGGASDSSPAQDT